MLVKLRLGVPAVVVNCTLSYKLTYLQLTLLVKRAYNKLKSKRFFFCSISSRLAVPGYTSPFYAGINGHAHKEYPIFLSSRKPFHSWNMKYGGQIVTQEQAT